jgi:acid stress-induced BolA-like protein IbaG/YrbA
MEAKQVEDMLKQALELDFVKVKAEGSHFEVIAVGNCFEGVPRVRQQQMVYAPLMDKISDGTLHAVSIKAYTPENWQRDRKLMML